MPFGGRLQAKSERLTTSESLALDVLRIGAALLVVAAHLCQPFFSTGWPSLIRPGGVAVAMLFILSGFVIRYVTTRRRGTFVHYAVDRASRIYSIVLPALSITVVADLFSRHVNPSFYSTWAYTFNHPVREIIENLVFTAQLWAHSADPLSNSPFWTLNYEVAYYALYGFAFYLSGWKRWLCLLATMLAVGPVILMYAPLWLAGCIIHDLYQRWNAPGTTARNLNWTIAACIPMLTLFVVLRIAARLLNAVRHTPLFDMHRFARIKANECLLGVVAMLLFVRLLVMLRRFDWSPDSWPAKTIRLAAEGTFPLYLLHFPLLVLIAACIPYNHASALPKTLIFLSVCALGALAGHPGNLFKMKLRSLVLRDTTAKTQA
jgi:peptidoglycan/LPS O-acetylase OafA/YrhL